MSVNTELRKSKRPALVEFPAIPHKFILKPSKPPNHKTEQQLKQAKQPVNEQSKTYPVLALRHRQNPNNNWLRWNIDPLPHLNGTSSSNEQQYYTTLSNGSLWKSVGSLPSLKGTWNSKEQQYNQRSLWKSVDSLPNLKGTRNNNILHDNGSLWKSVENLSQLKGTWNSNGQQFNTALGNRSSWKSVDSIPNLKSKATPRWIQSKLRALSSREDTFDADYMMPSRVREILESEGLEHGVINRAIGNSEEKHKQLLKKMAEGQRDMGDNRRDKTLDMKFPPIITTHTSNYSADGPSSWLDLAKQETQETHTISFQPLWENPVVQSKDAEDQSKNHADQSGNPVDESKNHPRKDTSQDDVPWKFGKAFWGSMDDVQVEIDKNKWQALQHAELLFFGKNFNPPRVVLVSSKIPKYQLLTSVYRDDVIPVVYDFEAWTFVDIIDEISRKLQMYRRNCKAKSIMVLCQGGPGYIYLLRNFVITPQKLHKPSYRRVVRFWRSLADLVSKINPDEAALHLFGFNMLDNDQGLQLLPMLQSLLYPNLVRMELLNDDSEEGKSKLEQYFRYARYKVWKTHQNTSVNDIDFVAEERSPGLKKKLTVSIR